MSETHEIEEAEDFIPPVSFDDAEDEETPDPPRRKRRTGPRKPYLRDDPTGHMSFDEYINCYDTDWPGLKWKLYRLKPDMWQGRSISGSLEERPGTAPFSEEEIRLLHGAGTYEVLAIGPRQYGDSRIINLGRKQCKISGERPLFPGGTQEGPPAPGAAPANDISAMAPQAQKGIFDLVSTAIQSGSKQAQSEQRVLSDAYKNQQQTIEKAAAERVKAAERQTEELRAELRRVAEESRKMAAEYEKRHEQVAKESNSTLLTLFPALLEQSTAKEGNLHQWMQMQIQSAQQAARADVEAQRSHYERVIDNQKQAFESLSAQMKVSAEMQVGLLRQQYEAAQQRVAVLERELAGLREKEHTRIMEEMQRRSPIGQLSEARQLLDTVRELSPGADSSGPADLLDEDAPGWQKLLASYAPAVQALAQRFTGGGQPQAMPQQPMPQHPAMHAQMMPQQQLPPQPAPMPQPPRPAPQQAAPPPPPAAPRVRINRDELAQACEAVAGFRDAGTSPEIAAQAALRALDNAMLKQLASVDPDKLIDQLSNADIYPQRLRDDAGRTYTKALLAAIRQQTA